MPDAFGTVDLEQAERVQTYRSTAVLLSDIPLTDEGE
jgi:hypothetical protein